MPWIPYSPVRLSKGQKHCEKCHGIGMVRVRFGGSISDDDFHTCYDCDGTGIEKKEDIQQDIKKN